MRMAINAQHDKSQDRTNVGPSATLVTIARQTEPRHRWNYRSGRHAAGRANRAGIMPGQIDRERVGHQPVQRDVVQAGAAGDLVRGRIHVRAGVVDERVLLHRVAVRRHVGKVAELRRRDARHDGHLVGHGVRQVDDLHLQRLSRRELATPM